MLLSKERIIAPPSYNRWLVPPASIAIHLCIGSVYAWSNFNAPLTKVQGVLASAPNDWTLGQVVWIFTVAIVCLGLSAAFAGKWLEAVGPRVVGVVAAVCWGGGFIVGSIGIALHQLWLLYLGYGVIGGCGLGLGYVSPVSTLLKWFPDRRGMATGLAIMGFGGGAIIGAPLIDHLVDAFHRAPEYLGTRQSVALALHEGGYFVVGEQGRRPVIVISEAEAALQPLSRAQSTIASPAETPEGSERVYAVGTGSSGVAQTFVMLGAGYFIVMILAAFSYRLPPPQWQPAGWTPPSVEASARSMISTNTVSVDEAIKTKQFYLLWIVLCFNVTAGIGVLGVAKTMLAEIFGPTLPDTITSAFASTFVLMISVFNMLGRFFWSSLSDYWGRKWTYAVYFLLGIPLYLSIPFWANRQCASPSLVWLVGFYAATMMIFTLYGGGFATIPAYLADLFGSRFVGGIHGRLLTAWSTAGVIGPWAITSLREHSLNRAIRDLAQRIEPARFAEKFGAPIEQLDTLTAAKTVTLSKLMELVPAGTVNPSATLYNSTMFVMAALLAVALLANALIRPVEPSHYLAD
jgi:MFS family permease